MKKQLVIPAIVILLAELVVSQAVPPGPRRVEMLTFCAVGAFVLLLFICWPSKRSVANPDRFAHPDRSLLERDRALREDVAIAVLVHLMGSDHPSERARIIHMAANTLKMKIESGYYSSLRGLIFDEIIERAGRDRRVAAVELAGAIVAKCERHLGNTATSKDVIRVLSAALDSAMFVSARFRRAQVWDANAGAQIHSWTAHQLQ
jgi:hypothetical protein